MKLLRPTLLALLVAAGTALAAPIDLSPVPARPSAVKLPKDWHRGVFMEIFVRAYQDSDTRPSIARGAFEHAFADGLVLGFQRRLGRERTLVLINYGSETATARVPGLASRTRLASLYGPRGTPLELPPQSVRLFNLRR